MESIFIIAVVGYILNLIFRPFQIRCPECSGKGTKYMPPDYSGEYPSGDYNYNCENCGGIESTIAKQGRRGTGWVWK